MFPTVVQPGVQIGKYWNTPVFTVASHDTGSAVLAVPTETSNYAYISSGTWSLLGLETRQPLISQAALEANLTSEGGAYGTFRPLKLVMGQAIDDLRRPTFVEARQHMVMIIPGAIQTGIGTNP